MSGWWGGQILQLEILVWFEWQTVARDSPPPSQPPPSQGEEQYILFVMAGRGVGQFRPFRRGRSRTVPLPSLKALDNSSPFAAGGAEQFLPLPRGRLGGGELRAQSRHLMELE